MKLKLKNLHSRFWERQRDPEQLLNHEVTGNKYRLQIDRNIKTGEFEGYNEVNECSFTL